MSNYITHSVEYTSTIFTAYGSCGVSDASGNVYMNGVWCYYISTEVMTWYDARTHCMSLEGDLSLIYSQEDHQNYRNMLNISSTSMLYWIGLSQRIFTWTTGKHRLQVQFVFILLCFFSIRL